MFEINYWKEAKKEYQHLDGSQRLFVDKALDRLKIQGMQAGAQLHGELHNCRKLKNRKMELRVVFTQENQKISIISIIAIGKRSNEEVYRDAEERIKKRH
ncbi:addiction module toxin RelE [Lactobacillus sp. LL6]|uniref:type II toxin-antitoxin system RelE family toxin n=1 Tax=Lactobacillus sp. LL6 TaxID=2596827 RepID=UPI001184D84E|nr:addiction module toxin RelE [Lactobacillus sp. LL6]TSO26897.1 addiction module toxin RelE [Lactobacillus sp. LL6]